MVGKYRNVPTTIDGIRFASKKEAHRYSELKLLERAGDILKLELQVPFRLDINDTHICNYIADFVYYDVSGLVVEDTKGMRTDIYKLKRALMWALKRIEIKET